MSVYLYLTLIRSNLTLSIEKSIYNRYFLKQTLNLEGSDFKNVLIKSFDKSDKPLTISKNLNYLISLYSKTLRSV